MSGKDLQGVNFRHANLENADLSNIITTRVTQEHPSEFLNCSFPNFFMAWAIELAHQQCRSAEVYQNEETRTYFNNANLRGATMNFDEWSAMHYVDFSGADLTGMEISNVGIRDSKFIGTTLNDIEIGLSVFFYVDFSNAELENFQFTDIPLDRKSTRLNSSHT